MRELMERHVRPTLRGAVDSLVGDPRGVTLQIATGAYALIALIAALLLMGVLPIPGREQTGALPVAAGASPSGQVLELSRQLRLEDAEGEAAAKLGELTTLEPATRAWLDQQLCKASFSDRRQREARAWRVDQNPGLCTGMDAALARAPLTVAFGPVGGTMLTLVVLLLLAAPVVLVFLWLPGVRGAYHSLYTSRHRLDRLGSGAP